MFSKKAITFFAIVLYAAYSLGHEAHHHAPHTTENKEAEVSLTEKKVFEEINMNYQKNVKSIFQIKCMTCHSSQTIYPFYYNWPIAKQIIDGDIAESKKHLDMTNGFPFAGHGTPSEDLEAIKKNVSNGSMPPFRYRIMHWGSTLTESEKSLITDWANESLKLLNPKP